MAESLQCSPSRLTICTSQDALAFDALVIDLHVGTAESDGGRETNEAEQASVEAAEVLRPRLSLCRSLKGIEVAGQEGS